MSGVWIAAIGLFAAAAGVGALAWAVRWGRVVRLGRGRVECRRCLYSLEGVMGEAERCPECGWVIDERAARRARFVGSRVKLGAGVGLAALGGVCIAAGDLGRAERWVWSEAPVWLAVAGVEAERAAAREVLEQRFDAATPGSAERLAIVRAAIGRAGALNRMPGGDGNGPGARVRGLHWHRFVRPDEPGLSAGEVRAARWLVASPRVWVVGGRSGDERGHATVWAAADCRDLRVRWVRFGGREVAFGVEPGTLEPGRTQALVWFEIPGGWDGGGGLVEFGVSMRYDPIDAGDATELSGVVSDRLTEAREGMWFFREPAAAVESAQMDGLLRRWGEQAMVLLSPDAGGGVRVELVGEGTLGGWVGPAEAWDRVSVSARLEVRFGGEAPGPIEAGAIVVDDAERRVALTGDALLSDAEAERVAAWWRASGGAGRAQLRIAARRELFPWFTRVVGDAWDGEVVIDDVPVQVTVPGWSADDDGGAGTGGGGGRDGGAG